MEKQKLTKEEKEAVFEAVSYYRDEATHRSGERVGYPSTSKMWKLLTSALRKINSEEDRHGIPPQA